MTFSEQFPCGTSGQNEAEMLVAFDERMDLVQEHRQLLDLVDNDDPVLLPQRLPQRLRIRAPSQRIAALGRREEAAAARLKALAVCEAALPRASPGDSLQRH
jgi:hypothetical protein